MEYTVKKLAELSGVSARTLRYYDQIGLLKPARGAENGYRVYTEAEVDLLQQILFYRELGVELASIGALLRAEDYDRAAVLESHLVSLREKQEQLARVIDTVDRTLCSLRGECTMSDKEKFAGLRQRALEENERRYGAELRERYGDEAIDAANEKFRGLSQEDAARAEALEAQIGEALRAASEAGDPAGPLAERLCALHREWLCLYWPSYTKAAHRGVAALYVCDERFRAYYDKFVPGGAEFLRRALEHYCAE